MRKKRLTLLTLGAMLLLISACQEAKKEDTNLTELKTEPEKLGYALGVDIGKSFSKNDMEISSNAFIQGFNDGLNEKESLLTQEEITEIRRNAAATMRQKANEKKMAQAEDNAKAGSEFLAENAKKEGVVTTESGLQYKIIKEGEGPRPELTDKVTVNYKGSLIDGTEFDSSYKRNQPATFPVQGVIPGWTEALQLMKEGSKWELYIPGELAYGERGAGQTIGPNATLVFETELLSVEKGPEPEAPAEKE